ncbi:hypothetical protein GCM10009547_46240 [Sporichthya brevicatena]|uniref:Uncharacterized protein n=1 Tax=Sporichthya brevicatena TaxID=171442 RepID=A0ABP3SFN6_9ACTN
MPAWKNAFVTVSLVNKAVVWLTRGVETEIDANAAHEISRVSNREVVIHQMHARHVPGRRRSVGRRRIVRSTALGWIHLHSFDPQPPTPRARAQLFAEARVERFWAQADLDAIASTSRPGGTGVALDRSAPTHADWVQDS